MFPRISFLLGLGVLILIAFYFVAAYVVVGPLAAFAPAWASVAAGAIVLLAVALTVNWLSGAMGSFNGVAQYGAAMPFGPMSYASQGTLALGHVGVALVTANLLRNDVPASSLQLLAIAVLYLAGLGIGVLEWKRFKARKASA